MNRHAFLNRIAWLEQSIGFLSESEANKEILLVIVELLKELKDEQA